ncbi:hypothetical protein [Streptomyces sp. NPDC093225]|uniref:hypothetical protein n=1 Tax=Streptomyces sp. NPDC093225 TaxID=3366034 RepID=UPI00382D0A9A
MDISGVRLRALRAALFSAVVVVLSTATHVLVSRVPLPPTLVGGAYASVFAIAFALAGRERGFWHIAGLLVPLELAADTVLTTGQDVCYGPSGGPVSGPLKAMGLDVLCGGPPVGAPLARVAGTAGDPAALLTSPAPATPWLLLAAHVSVGLLASLWLRRGERALAGLVEATAAAAFRPLRLAVAAARAVAAPALRTVRAGRARAVARTRFPAHSVGRRGPPRTAPCGA